MKLKTTTLVLSLVFFALHLNGSELNISWKEGKDNRYNYPVKLLVTDATTGKPVAGAEILCEKEMLGKTDKNGVLSTNTLNGAAVKYSLKACLGEKCSKPTIYQVLPSEFPYPAFISMGEDPTSSMSFTWHTDKNCKDAVVECILQDDPAGFGNKQAMRVKGTSYPQEITDVDKPEGKTVAVMVHKATVNGLSADTRYRYRVGDGKHWREGLFTTAVSTDDKREIKFLFTADSQESLRENYQKISRNVVNTAFSRNPDIRFILHGGDMVNRGKNGQEWSWFFEANEKYYSVYPLASVPGNHEAGGTTSTQPQQRNQYYLNYFNNPSNHTGLYAEGSSYSFNYGPVHILCIDMQNLDDAMEISAAKGDRKYLDSAREWIRKDLETATQQQKWKLIVMHQPIYGANRDEKEFREVLAPLFDKGKADVVITGHDHYYFRSFPMRYDSLKNDGEPVPMDQFGTVYLIGGSTSTKMYFQKFARPYQAVVMSKALYPGRYPFTRNEELPLQNYSIFTVSGEKLHYRFYDMNGKQLDEFILDKKPRQ
jgi:hypothetical protein